MASFWYGRAWYLAAGASLLAYVREGDTVVVWKLDRLGRNMFHILHTVKELTDRGVTLVSTTDGIDSSTPAGRMMIGVLGSLAEYERDADCKKPDAQFSHQVALLAIVRRNVPQGMTFGHY
jgi:hypothetical protein